MKLFVTILFLFLFIGSIATVIYCVCSKPTDAKVVKSSDNCFLVAVKMHWFWDILEERNEVLEFYNEKDFIEYPCINENNAQKIVDNIKENIKQS